MMCIGSRDLLLFSGNKAACFMMANAYHVFLVFYFYHTFQPF